MKIGADLQNFDRQMKKMQKSIGNIGDKMQKLGKRMSIAFTVPLMAIGTVGLKTASDLKEVQNVVDTAFGESAETINKWSKTTLKAFGLSQLQAKQFAGVIRSMTGSMGLSAKEADNMSMRIAELTGDMASFYNLGVDDMFTKIRSGLSGEIEPLKALGINLSVANMEAFRMSKGIRKAYNEMTEAEKVTLRYNYILDTTKNAHGDFSKTNDSFANSLRVVKVQFMEVAAQIMTNVLPMLETLLSNVRKVLDWFSGLNETQKTWILVLAAVVAALGPLLIILGSLINTMTMLNVYLAITGTTMWATLWPILAIIAGIAAVIAIIVLLVKHWDKVTKFFKKSFEVITVAAKMFWDGLVNFGRGAINGIISYLNFVMDAYKWMINGVIKILNSAIKGFNKLPGVNIGVIPEISKDFLRIPKLAKGGIAMPRPGGILANIAEAGEPEAVIPLSKLDSMVGGKGNTTVIVELDGRTIAQTTAPHIMGQMRLKGGFRG